MENLREEMEKVQDLISINLKSCCREFLEWNTSGILCDGVFRSIISQLPVPEAHKISVGSRILGDAAMEFVVKN